MSETDTDLNVFTENLAQLPQKLDSAAFEILWQGAYLILGEAQVNCPVITGFLRDSGMVHIIENSEGRKTVTVGFSAPYAAIVEARTPFLGPAVADVLPQLETALRSLQENVIDVNKQ